MSVSAQDVAAWMASELRQNGALHQETAVGEIASRFGDEFTRINANGNTAIQKNVLDAFNKLTAADVVWIRSERMWRKREDYDTPGRQQP